LQGEGGDVDLSIGEGKGKKELARDNQDREGKEEKDLAGKEEGRRGLRGEEKREGL
jgi:hypothetical protein